MLKIIGDTALEQKKKKETRLKIETWVGSNLPSNNWAQMFLEFTNLERNN